MLSGKASMRILLLLILILLHPVLSYSQENISFEYLDADQGLSNAFISSITQDKYGFLWFGTQFGLNRYDGYEITKYFSDSENPRSMSGDSIITMLCDRQGNLWIGSVSGGLNRYDYDTDSFISFPLGLEIPGGLSDSFVKAICQDEEEKIWVGTAYGGLSLLRKDGTFQNFMFQVDNPHSISNNDVTAIISLDDGRLLVGTARGLNVFDQETEMFSSDWELEILSRASISALYQDSSNTVWIATENNGTFILKSNGRLAPIDIKGPPASVLAKTYINKIIEDADGNFWFCTSQYGVLRFSPSKDSWLIIQNRPDSPGRLPHNSMRTVYQDSSGIIWLGTEKGVVKHNKNRDRFRVYLNDRAGNSNIQGRKVFSILPKDINNVWVGSGDGGVSILNLMNDESENLEIFTDGKNSLNRLNVRALKYDSEGNLLIGTEGQGLFVYNLVTKSYKHFNQEENFSNGLRDNFIRFVFIDSKNRLWLGSEKGGLSRLNPDGKTFTTYLLTGDTSGPSSNRVFCMLEDEKGLFWLGTDKGVNIFDEEKGEFSTPVDFKGFKGQLKAGLVICGHEDVEGNLWFGTTDGLHYLDRKAKEIRNFSTRDGLPDNLVYAITEDQSGNLWFSTNDGIVQLNKETGEINTISVFKAPLTNEYNVGAVCRLPTGEMLFGAMHGLVRFVPGHLEDNTYNPPVYLSSFKKYEEKFDLGSCYMEVKKIDILPQDHFVTLEFVSLDYDRPLNNQYRYKLIGLEDEWINLANRRFISFTGLPPNSYRLVVQGSNSEGRWSENQVEIDLIVHPYFWDTWWFRTLAGMVLVAGILLFYRTKTKSVRRQRDILRRQVAQRTKQLTEQNERLNQQKHLLEEKSETLKQTNKELESFTYTVAHDLRAPLRHIAGFTDLIHTDLNEKMDETAETYFARINGSINRMNELIDNFLRFATSTKHDIIRTEVNISRIAMDTMRVIQESDPERKVKLDITKNMIEQCDLKLIKVVLENLLSNSWKYSQTCQETAISVGRTDENGQRVYFVKDNGVGFDNKRAKEIFKPFQRLHSDKEFSGIGIGLATVQRIIHRHGGRVWAEGKVNAGSTFFFTLN